MTKPKKNARVDRFGSVRRLTEGHIKKGGVNQRPNKPKPDIKPVGQRPKPKGD